MKIQNLAVIFVIIILPISIVLSTYTGKLINVVKAQADYDKLLMNSTYDAIRAYQMNTLNDNYDQVSNAKVRDINASINSFFNSLAAGMSWGGYTKRELIDYVPAMLYTLYDGYYVYSAYDNIVKINGSNLEFNEQSKLNNKQYGLKPFCYYSCTYSDDSTYNIVINYTLDNYITVTGRYKDDNGNWQDIAASGYYIKYDRIKFGNDKGNIPSSIPNLNDKKVFKNEGADNEIMITPEKLGEYIKTVDTRKSDSGNTTYQLSYTQDKPKYYQYIMYKNSKYYLDVYSYQEYQEAVLEGRATEWTNNAKRDISDSWTGIPIFHLDKGRRVYINRDMFDTIKQFIGAYDEGRIYSGEDFLDVNNYNYYYNAVKFSRDVADVLSKINLGTNSNGIIANQEAEKEADVENLIQNTVIKTRSYHQRYASGSGDKGVESHIKTTYDTSYVFKTSEDNDPELESSSFNQHRMDVIISSIENSLMNAISNYSNYSKSTYEYMMPMLHEDEWDRICNNLTVVSFMQGLTMQNYKYYSGYAVVANTKTKDFASKDSIYVQDNNAENIYYPNSSTEYHNPRCTEFNKSNSGNIIGYKTIDYMRQDVYLPGKNASDDGTTYYYYLQPGQAAYECNVGQNNNIYTTDELLTGKVSESRNKEREELGSTKLDNPNSEVRKAYISALAREKGAKYNRYDYLNLK